jgi:hypothetical protein
LGAYFQPEPQFVEISDQCRPAAVVVNLQWPVVRFIRHFLAIANPVTKVEIFKAEFTRLFDFPEDGVNTQTAFVRLWVEKRVDSRQPVFELVNHSDRFQRAFIIEAKVASTPPYTVQKCLVLLAVGRMHVAISVALHYVSLVEMKRFIVINVVGAGETEVLVALPYTLLPTSGLELRNWYPCWDTGIALSAMGSVDMVATAPEAKNGKLAVQFLINGLTRVYKKRGGDLLLKVAAAMGVGGVHLEIPQG